MAHPNQKTLEAMYEQYAAGNMPGFLSPCAPNCTFQVAGKNGGKFNKETFPEYFAKLSAKGAFRFDMHEILASDRHGIVLASDFFTRNGDTTQVRTVHVWRFENGQPVAWYEYPRDLYQFDGLL